MTSPLASYFGRPFGCFTDVFPGTPAEKAAALAAAGFDCVQLVSATPALELTPSLMREEIAPFVDAGLRIVAVSGYQNIIAPDPRDKADALARLGRLFELAALCGVGVACETGTKSLVSPWEFSPENLAESSWDEMMVAVGDLSRTAIGAGSRFLIEGYVNNVVRTADDLVKLKAAIPALGFVVDPFNLILEERMSHQAAETARILDAIGDGAVLAHAKDLIYKDGRVDTPRAGAGVFDYPAYFRLLDARLPGLPLVVEHVRAPQLAESLDYLKRRYAETQE